MFKPAGVVTAIRSNWCQSKKLSKPLVAIFVLIQMIFGINYGFFAAVTNRSLRALAKLVSAINFPLTIIAYAYYILQWDQVALVLGLNYLGVFITMLISKYTVFNFFMDLMAADVSLNFNMNSYIGLKTSVFLILEYCFRIVVTVLFCMRSRCFEKSWIILILTVIYETKNYLSFVLTGVNILIYNLIYMRLKFLRAVFEQEERQIKNITMLFKALADCFSKIRVSQDKWVVMGFLVNLYKCTFVLFLYLKVQKDSPDVMISIFIIVETVYLMIQVCQPALIVEQIAVQIDEIKLLILERVLIETNGENKKELLALLRYIEARPLTYKAWRLVPVDLRLPVSLLSMTATYLIVLVQFTHLY